MKNNNSKKKFNGSVKFYSKKCVICSSANNLEPFIVTNDIRIAQNVTTVICNSCGLIFLNPAPTDESYMEFYQNQRGGEVSRKTKYEFLYKKEYLHRLIVQILVDNIPLLKDSNTIDVGSGNGAFLHYLKPYVGILKALEVSKNAQIDIPRFFNCEVIEDYTLKNIVDFGSLDLLTSNAVIEHYNDPHVALKDYYDALRPGGRLLIYTHNIKGLSFSAGENSYFKFIHPYYFSPNTLRILVKKSGFNNIKIFDFPCNDKYRSICSPSRVLSGFFVLIAEKTNNIEEGNLDINGIQEVDESREALHGARIIEKKFFFKKMIYYFISLLRIGKINKSCDLYNDAYVSYMQSREK